MARLIERPTGIQAAGEPPKMIEEFVGRVNSDTEAVSIARMTSPAGWSEPGQTPRFDEYSIHVYASIRDATMVARDNFCRVAKEEFMGVVRRLVGQ